MSEYANANGDAAHQLHQLKSYEKDELLSAIDRLRLQHIDADIHIPQVVVCGDQSSGKSSVLEAIANVPFPIGASTTTRFAIEVILRQGVATKPKITLCASPDRTGAKIREVTAFKSSFEASGSVDFGNAIEDIVDEARTHLRNIDNDAKFWSDWLRIEVSGPDQPHLTLVDLPGIIQTETGPNAVAGDKNKIKNLVTKYIEKQRTIVLAIVDAQNDPDNQEILELVDRIPGARSRTLGVLTKPDKPGRDSDLEKNVISLASNERTQLGLGWHVLKNLPHEETDRTHAQRNELEREFFETGAWTNVARNNVGIHNLCKKLGEHLFGCIAVGLPDLIDQMRRKLARCESTLSRLGPGRDSVREQKTHLHAVLSKLERLIKDALEGEYQRSEFEDFFDGVGNRRLRDRIRNDSEAFASEIRDSGRQYHIYWDGTDDPKKKKNTHFRDAPPTHEPKFGSVTSTGSATIEEDDLRPMNIAFEHYRRILAAYMMENRGKNLPTMQSTGTIQAIFRQQSTSWQRIAANYGNECCSLTHSFLESAAVHVAGPHMGNALMRGFVHERMSHRRKQVEENIRTLLWPYRQSHPMTYNPKYSARVRRRTEQPSESTSTVQSWGGITRDTVFFGGGDSERDAADALDQTEVYYDIALNTFIENVPSLAIEMSLLNGLGNTIAAKEVFDMSDEKISMIASEPAEAKQERAKAEAQKEALDEVIGICQRYARRGSVFRSGTSSASQPPGAQEQPVLTSSASSLDPNSFSSKRPKSANSGSGAFGRSNGFAAASESFHPAYSGPHLFSSTYSSPSLFRSAYSGPSLPSSSTGTAAASGSSGPATTSGSGLFGSSTISAAPSDSSRPAHSVSGLFGNSTGPAAASGPSRLATTSGSNIFGSSTVSAAPSDSSRPAYSAPSHFGSSTGPTASSFAARPATSSTGGGFGSFAGGSSDSAGKSGGSPLGKSYRAQPCTKTAGTGASLAFQPTHDADESVFQNLFQNLTAHEDFRDFSSEVSPP